MTENEAMLLDALKAIAPHLMLAHEPVVSDCLARSHGDQLRLAAEQSDKHDAAVRKVRDAISRMQAQK